jgi:hypothetical protein
MFTRLARFLLQLFVPSPLPDSSEASRPHRPSVVASDNLQFNGLRPTPIEGEIVCEKQPVINEKPSVIAADGPTILLRMAQDHRSSNTSYYRDEDGEMRPVRLDRSGLAEAMLEDLAAEFLRAKADAEAAPDALERDVISALRDTYSRELWRRAQRGAEHVHVGGRDYVIVPRDAGIVDLVMTA